jgi:hypothetical protein
MKTPLLLLAAITVLPVLAKGPLTVEHLNQFPPSVYQVMAVT